MPIGTGNKTERMFGYFTWHGDDAPPVNPLGDLFKTQVWALATSLGTRAAAIALDVTRLDQWEAAVAATTDTDLDFHRLEAREAVTRERRLA